MRTKLLLFALALLGALTFAGVALADATADTVTTNAQKWNLLVGAILPAVIAALKKTRWPMPLQSLFALAACAAAAVGTTYWQSTLSWENWTTSALTIATVTWATYGGMWKPTGIADKIDSATDWGKPARRRHRA
jgi:hypothetical protein